MANKFKAGMLNFIEVLNQMWDAFSAGPYNALPLTGGNLTGPVASSAGITTDTFMVASARGARTGAGTGSNPGWWKVAKLDPSRFGGEAVIRLSGTTTFGANPASSNGMLTTILLRADNDGVIRGSFYSVGAHSSDAIIQVAIATDGTIYVNTEAFYTLSVYLDTNMWLPQEVSYAGRVTPPNTHEAYPIWGLKIGANSTLTVTPTDITTSCDFTGRRLLPSADNQYDIGQSATAYRTIYARTGTINTSDARLKTDFRFLTPAEIAAACDIARAIGIYRWRDAIDSKGAGAREHVGPTVQAAIEIMQGHDLDPFNYGFICHDMWEQQAIEHPAIEARPAIPATEAAPAVMNSFGEIVTPAVMASPGYPAIDARAAYTEVTLEAGDRYAFRYDELAMFIAAGQAAHQDALELRIAALEVA